MASKARRPDGGSNAGTGSGGEEVIERDTTVTDTVSDRGETVTIHEHELARAIPAGQDADDGAPAQDVRIVGPVRLDRPGSDPTNDQWLWWWLRNRTRAIAFDNYSTFVNLVMCGHPVDGLP